MESVHEGPAPRARPKLVPRPPRRFAYRIERIAQGKSGGKQRPVMKVLLVHENGVMSELLVSDLVSAGLGVTALASSATNDATLRAACGEVDSVLYVCTGWDTAAAGREISQLEVLISALQGTMKRLLYVSDATVIGDTGDSFGNEDNPTSLKAPHPWRVAAEGRMHDAVARGVHSIIVRPALVHGREAGELLHSLMTYAAKSGESVYVGNGEARVSTVHVDDVISLIRMALIRAPRGGIYPAASDEALSWRDVADAVAGATERHCTLQSISPARAEAAGLDAATMAVNNVMRDLSATRRLRWRPTGPPLFAGR